MEEKITKEAKERYTVWMMPSTREEVEDALLNGRQKGIALRFVETVTFVQKQIGTLAKQFQIIPCLFHRLFYVRNPCVDGV